MHELSAALEIVKTVERFASENGIDKVDTVVLQLGELSSYIPSYIEAIFPAAADGTQLQNAKLRIETIPASGRCLNCGTVYHIAGYKNGCPQCGDSRRELLSGKEFYIKEIEVS